MLSLRHSASFHSRADRRNFGALGADDDAVDISLGGVPLPSINILQQGADAVAGAPSESSTTYSTILDGIDLSTQPAALVSLDLTEAWLTRLGEAAGRLGASESRLGAVTSVLRTRRDGLAEAASRILDVDVAEESSALTRNNILQQVASAVLAQANQTPQLALTLLGG